MATWLEAHYTSDNVSSSDAISNSWNKFFIDVRHIMGKNNYENFNNLMSGKISMFL